MSESAEAEREFLESLLKHPGWLWFLKVAEEQWTGADAFRRRVLGATQQGAEGHASVVQTMAVCEALRHLVDAPRERLALLRTSEEKQQDAMNDPFRRHRRIP